MTTDERKQVAALRRHLAHVSKLLFETFEEVPWVTDGTYNYLESKMSRALARSALLLDLPKLNPYVDPLTGEAPK